MIRVEHASKTFTLHLRDGARIAAVHDVSFAVRAGACVELRGPSGAGKSTLLKMIYGNYRCDTGRLLLRDGAQEEDMATAAPRRVIALRRSTIGYVSQFLRVLPRVPTLEVVAAEARAQGRSPDVARREARDLLAALHLPERLWDLPPATFSGGERQRVNIARGFVGHHPILLLDEPTASLDSRNRAAVIDLIRRKKQDGVALLGIFHDDEVRASVTDDVVEIGLPG